MSRADLYTQIRLLEDLYFGCPDTAAWDKDQEDYIHALEESRQKKRWLKNVNRPYKGRWYQ